MDDEDNTPIVQAHRYGRQACEAQARGHWQQAIDKHTRASQQFQSLTTYTSEPQALLALRLLSQHHLDAAQHIQRTLYHESPSYQSTPRIITTTTTTLPPTTSTSSSTSEQLTHLTRLLAILRTKPFEMEQRDFDILMGTFEELRAIVAKPNLPSQAVRKSHADIETDLQSHLHFGRDIQSRMSTLTGRPEEMSTLRDLIPTLIRQHASLAQNEAALQRENESLRQIIHAMQENYAQKSTVLTTALTTAFRPMITTTTTTTTTDTNMIMDGNKLLSEKMKLEKQLHILSKQLKAEMAQVKKQNAVIEEQKQRWHNLKEAARNKRERERNRIAGTGTAPANMQPVPGPGSGPGPGPGPGPTTATSFTTSVTSTSTSTSTSSSTPSHRPTLSVGSATPSSSSSSSSTPVKK